MQSRRKAVRRAVRRDNAKPFVDTSVGASVETIIRLPSILVLRVSRALRL